MKKVTLALFMGLCLCVSLATAQVNEAAPAESVPSNGSPDYIGDLLYSVDVETPTGDVRMLGFCDDGSHFWCTGANDMITAYLYEFDENWNLLNSFVTGHTSWAWRDLCFDGAFLYASDSGVIDQIDRTTGMGTGVTIPSPVIPARAMAYDPDLDCFWTASWSSDLYQVFRDGSYNSFANILTGVYGMAWDGRDPVAPMLWIWSQDGSGAQATQFDPLTGTFTGVTWDGDATLGIAGGADLFTDPANGTVLGGMHQGSPDVVAVYHMEDAPPMIPPTMDLKVNGGDTGVIVPEGANATFTLDIAANQNLGDDVDIFIGVHKSGRFFAHDGTDFVPWAPGDAGVYFSGQLADMSATVYDLPVPLGNYKLKAIIDTNMNGMLDMNMATFLLHDWADFTCMSVSGFSEDFEDGVADNWVPDGTHWFVDQGVYVNDCPSFAQWISYYDFDYSDFTYSADMRMEDTGNTSDYYYFGFLLRSDGTLSNC